MRVFAVNDQSHVAEVRREAGNIGRKAGLPEDDLGRLAIVATELATNQLKHAGHGEILVGVYEDATGGGVELVGIDKGPGIRNLDESFRDGHSTAGSAGQGLGSLRRQSDVFDIASWPERGTAILARITARKPGRSYLPPASYSWGGLSVPLPGEDACGDAFSVRCEHGRLSALVADGLGHGPVAATASSAAVRAFAGLNGTAPVDALRIIHDALRPTRGAAVALLRLDDTGAHYAGIGNIAGAVVRSEGMSRMVSVSGTAGVTQTKVRVFTYPAGPGALVVLASDGVMTNWQLDAYPGLKRAHPTLIAAVLFRDFSRRRDDATVVVIRAEHAVATS
ncbi:ATP-binding protein [Dongia sedimenti]|uniref:ATP-binding protein/SpoIIE family protein phosphatase n=1 Tax=Dongia sedimenti TaxID=3064282 RepID=A0ABU0YMP9_9PROT|nr:ATP-binding protein/SpoIIE family protein phosphatase [Rhodospirillaceae bacterium R-7]